MPRPAQARRLRLHNLNTGERFSGPYWVAGAYLDDAVADINHVLRDHHRDEAAAMDRDLIDLAWRLSGDAGADGTLRVTSAYRSLETNEMLIRRGYRAARNSYHLKGKALDIAVARSRLGELRDRAQAMLAGGVGYYPGMGIVHVDTGPVRTW